LKTTKEVLQDAQVDSHNFLFDCDLYLRR